MGRSQGAEPRPTYVYAIGDAEQRLVKIGYSKNPLGRLASIQTACPFAVSIHWQTEGGALLEDALHRHFADYHSHGEWFNFPAGQNAAELISRAVEEIAIPVGSHVLQLQRVIYEDGEPVEVAVSWIRENRIVSYSMERLPDGSVQAREPDERDEEWDRLMANNPFLGGGRPYRSCIGPVVPARMRRVMGDTEPS